MTEALVRSICAEFEIEIVPANVFPMPGQTRAVATMCRILRNHGEGHFRLVMTTLAETKDNQGLIDEHSLGAVSDLVRACPEWVEKRTSEWLEWWDKLPLGWIMYSVSHLRGVSQQRHALAGAIYHRLWAMAQESMTGKGATDKLRKRVGEANTLERRIELGRRLIKIKADLPHGHFGPWVRDKSGLSPATVHNYMRLAREAGQQERSAA
ncbi:DUF3102 domain-containing protein [Sinorhizobium fredii]|uniref:DUF3102 domain-containing protein n=1 Tax=Rhizobium fredii TaxID=380 RepID=UPI0004AF535A|nr:DUF3102 domain-containing protein [Sinorhizobium fredii]